MMTMTTIETNHAAHAVVLRSSVRATATAAMTGVLAFNPRSATDRRDQAHGRRAGDVTMVIAGRDHGSAAARADSRIAVRAARNAALKHHSVVDHPHLPHAVDTVLIGEANAGLSRRSVADHLPLQHVVDVAPIAVASTGSSRHSGVDRPPSDRVAVPITGRVLGVIVGAAR